MLTSVPNQGVTNGILQWPTPSQNLLSPLKIPQSSLCFTAAEEELGDDIDRDFILDGIKHGFDIIDTSVNPIPVQCENYTSARPGSTLYHQATKQVLKEIQMGHYEVVPTSPEIIRLMGGIPKPDGGVRLIHDCSQPPGKSVNDYCTTEWKQKYSRVHDAAALVTEGCYIVMGEEAYPSFWFAGRTVESGSVMPVRRSYLVTCIW